MAAFNPFCCLHDPVWQGLWDQLFRDLVLWGWHGSTELFSYLYYSSSNSASSSFSPSTGCSLDWIPQRVLAHRYFPAELPGGLRGAQQPHTWDNTHLHPHIHDPPASPSHGHLIPITAQSPHTRQTQPQVWCTAGHSWEVSAVETSSGGQGLLVTPSCQFPQPHLLSVGSNGSQLATALRAQLQFCTFPGKVHQCLKKQNPQDLFFLWEKAVNSQIQPAAGSGLPDMMQLVGDVLHHQKKCICVFKPLKSFLYLKK